MVAYSKQDWDRRRRSLRMWYLGLAALALYGFWHVDAFDIALGYLAVCIAGLWPARIWIMSGGGGVPILPLVGLIYLQFYGLPMLGKMDDFMWFAPTAVLQAGLTVVAYLVAATLTWVWARKVSRRPYALQQGGQLLTDVETIRLCMLGVGWGAAFEIAVLQDWLNWLGSSFGVVRAIAHSGSLVASYFLGVLIGQRKLRADQRRTALLLFVIMVVVTVSSLFLVRGIMLFATLMFAYFITARRIPLMPTLAILGLAFVLHAGKAEMRDEYWMGDSHLTSIIQIPGLYVQWIDRGVNALVEDRGGQSLIERSSLLQMLLRAQAETPQRLDYLYGATYALLPPMLVPRFLWPDKPVSQAAMNMLNLRYGLVALDQEGNIRTAIGWGVIAEAYINFSLSGVIGVGLLMGAFMGWIEGRSLGQPAVSLPTLLAIITMVTLINLEADLGYLITILFQSYISILLVYWLLRLRRRHQQGPGIGQFQARG